MQMTRQRENPVDAAQTLVSYLDSSFAEMQPLFAALDAFETLPKHLRLPDEEAFREDIETAEECFAEAWDTLEDGEDPLMSETYIDWSGEMEDEAEFRDRPEVETKLDRIENKLTEAFNALDAAYQRALDADPIRTAAIDGDFGGYDEFDEYVKYVRSQAEGMRDFTRQASEGV